MRNTNLIRFVFASIVIVLFVSVSVSAQSRAGSARGSGGKSQKGSTKPSSTKSKTDATRQKQLQDAQLRQQEAEIKARLEAEQAERQKAEEAERLQKIKATNSNAESSLLANCGGVNFHYVITEIPGANGNKQQVEVIAENTNNFRVHVSFAFQAISDEGKKYTSPSGGNGYNAGRSGTHSKHIPFGDEDLNRNSYPRIAQMGLLNLDVRNVEKLGNTAGAYSRGEKIGTCNPQMKKIAFEEPIESLLKQTLYIEDGRHSEMVKFK